MPEESELIALNSSASPGTVKLLLLSYYSILRTKMNMINKINKNIHWLECVSSNFVSYFNKFEYYIVKYIIETYLKV